MKVAIAMSGGVDSSVVAKLLKDEGHELVGLFLKLWQDPLCTIAKENRCCNYEALEDARRVAHSLDIPFYVINAKDEFKKEVVDYFIDEYKKLNTPNPCIVCNEKIKFDLLMKKALSIGCEKLATGHYARILEENSSGKSNKLVTRNYKLKTGIDATKDQSYMLYRLDQNQLSKVLFPLGEMTKKEVRTLAVKWNLPVKEKPESQEICFIGDKDYREFLGRYLPEKYFKPGEIVDRKGNVLGKHEGLINYTIGQRKGINQVESRKLKVESDKPKQPLYVIGFDVQKNQLIVGEDEDIYQKEMIVSNLNWILSKSRNYQLETKNLSVKIRYRHEAVPCKLMNLRTEELKDNETVKQFNNLHVMFDKPQRAITPGQSAVFYSGDVVLGGGIIE